MKLLRTFLSILPVALILVDPSFSTAQIRTTPTAGERTELLSVREQVWDSYFCRRLLLRMDRWPLASLRAK